MVHPKSGHLIHILDGKTITANVNGFELLANGHLDSHFMELTKPVCIQIHCRKR